MSEYHPDYWVIVRVTDCDKVLAGWSGGYLDGDAWKMNSGITKVVDAGKYWHFHGVTGSVYVCHKEMERVGRATMGVMSMLDKAGYKTISVKDIKEYHG